MSKSKKEILAQIQGGLIVSCQALDTEPLHSPFIMSKMALAAMMGGAVGIRANTVEDIKAIKEEVELPVIGIIKRDYDDSDVYITPTINEVEMLISCGCEIIAMDATNRIRPERIWLEQLFPQIRNKYPSQLFMADCSCISEGIQAEKLGFDLIGTTMCSYTPYTSEVEIPSYNLISELSCRCKKPVIAEGGIWEPEQLRRVFEKGAFAAVVGGAITRPMQITKRFVEAIS